MKDGFETQAQVAFVIVRDIVECDAANGLRLMGTLHQVLRAAVPRKLARVTSSLHGAIIVVPDETDRESRYDLRECLPAIFSGLHGAALPFRMGVTYGRVVFVRDADDRGIFIGEAINAAARIAYSSLNKGVLFDETFRQAGVASVRGTEGLPVTGATVNVEGKKHDTMPFVCHESRPPVDGGNGFAGFRPAADSEVHRELNGIALAFDLEEFSSGDLATLGKRFRDLVGRLKKSLGHVNADRLFYSPGGDGGIVVITGESHVKRGIEIAHDIRDSLRLETTMNRADADVRCRIGVHAGPILLYKNAEKIERPTGLTCLITNDLAAKQPPGTIVFSESVRLAVSRGSRENLARDFTPLAPLKLANHGEFARFVEKTAANQNPAPTALPKAEGAVADDSEAGRKLRDAVTANLKALLDGNPRLAEQLGRIFADSNSEDRSWLATNLARYIANNFEMALDLITQPTNFGGPKMAGDMHKFLRLVLPLGVSETTLGSTTPQTVPMPTGALRETAQLHADAIAGLPYSGRPEEFGSDKRGAREIDVGVHAGPWVVDKVEDIKREIREALANDIRRQLRLLNRLAPDFSDADLAALLRKRWEMEPEPFFVVLSEAQRQLGEWLTSDAVGQYLLRYQQTPGAPSLVKISPGTLIAMMRIFAVSIQTAAKPTKNP